jgi:hypothetical protein
LSKLTTPETIGISSSITSLAAIFGAIGSIGMPLAVHRLVGNMYFEHRFQEIKVLLEVSLIIIGAGLIAAVFLSLLPKVGYFIQLISQ